MTSDFSMACDAICRSFELLDSKENLKSMTTIVFEDSNGNECERVVFTYDKLELRSSRAVSVEPLSEKSGYRLKLTPKRIQRVWGLGPSRRKENKRWYAIQDAAMYLILDTLTLLSVEQITSEPEVDTASRLVFAANHTSNIPTLTSMQLGEKYSHIGVVGQMLVNATAGSETPIGALRSPGLMYVAHHALLRTSGSAIDLYELTLESAELLFHRFLEGILIREGWRRFKEIVAG